MWSICEAIEEGHEVCIFGTLRYPDNVRLTEVISIFFMGISDCQCRSFLLDTCILALPHINQVVHTKDIGFSIFKH